MKNRILFGFSLFFFLQSLLVYSQIKYTSLALDSHIKGSGDEIYFQKDILFLPERMANGNIIILKYDCALQKQIGSYYPPDKYQNAAGFIIEDGFIYLHRTEYIAKVDIQSNAIIWESKYNSQYAAQIDPFIYENYIGIDLDDKIFIVDKLTGALVADIKEKNLSQSIAFTKDFLIYGKEGGKLIAYDLKKKSKCWKFDVGGDVGYGCLDLGDQVVLPSGDVKIFSVDTKTGKKKWSIEKDDLKASCGSGFNEPPILFDNKLYVLQRESGLYEIEKNSGAILSVTKIDETLDDRLIVYNNLFFIASTKGLFKFNPMDKSVSKVSDLNVDKNLPFSVQFNGQFLCLNYVGSYTTDPKVLLFDLQKLIDN